MSADVTKVIAANAPTTIEDLKALGVLGDKKVEEYGARLVRSVQKFVEGNSLQEYISKRPLKRAKHTDGNGKPSAAAAVPKPQSNRSIAQEIIDIDDEEDEFDSGIDYSAIELPG